MKNSILTNLVFLHFQQPQPTTCQNENLPSITSQRSGYENKPACVVDPSKTGEFVFNGVASGKYLVRPFIKNQNIQLQIQPEFIEFEVLKDSLSLSDSFAVTGFNAVGRVLTAPNGFGVSNAKILINSQEAAITHTDGSYVLKNIKSETYAIQAVANDVKFNEITTKVSLANPTIPDIVVSTFKVCGQLVSQRSFIIAITKQSSTFHTQTSSKVGTGEWCAYLPTGRFTVQVLTSAEDKAQGIQ